MKKYTIQSIACSIFVFILHFIPVYIDMFIGKERGYYGSLITGDLVDTTPVLYVIFFFIFLALFLILYFLKYDSNKFLKFLYIANIILFGLALATSIVAFTWCNDANFIVIAILMCASSAYMFGLSIFNLINMFKTKFKIENHKEIDELSQIKLLINDLLDNLDKYNTKNCYYPDRLEDSIQLAIDYKTKGKYLKAVKEYLEIFKRENSIYGAILIFLYKVLACAGLITEAINIIKLGEKIYIESGAKDTVPEVIRKTIPSAYESHYNRLIEAFDNESTLYNYLKSISGNNNYIFNIPYNLMLEDLRKHLKSN